MTAYIWNVLHLDTTDDTMCVFLIIPMGLN